MKYHSCANIVRAIEELKKGNNCLDCSPNRALKELTDAQLEGKTYYSGCDNMDKDGRCGGHKD